MKKTPSFLTRMTALLLVLGTQYRMVQGEKNYRCKMDSRLIS